MKLAYVDSCIWIARIEGLPDYRKVIGRNLQKLVKDEWLFCTSDVVALEVLLKPLQNNQEEVIQKYKSLFLKLRVLKNYSDVFKNALLIAQNEHLKAMDAIHVTIATHHNCTLFVSSDPQFRHLKTITPYWIDLGKSHKN